MRRAISLAQAQATVTARLKKKRERAIVLKQRGIVTRKSVKAKKDRVEALRIKLVRALVEARDGYCRVAKDGGDWDDTCGGASQWCHFAEKKRARTRKMAPEFRHTTEHAFMACASHHEAYDSGELKITALTEGGCDGRLGYRPSWL